MNKRGVLCALRELCESFSTRAPHTRRPFYKSFSLRGQLPRRGITALSPGETRGDAPPPEHHPGGVTQKTFRLIVGGKTIQQVMKDMFRLGYVRSVLTALIYFTAVLSFGQSFELTKMEHIPTDLTASTQSRVDLNGVKCGLVKVQCVLEGVTFSGNVIGKVEEKEGEYWVYMTNGSKFLSINHPKLLPLNVAFMEFLGSEIKSGYTYRMILSIPKALYNALVLPSGEPSIQESETDVATPPNTKISGFVKDKHGDELIGCTVMLKNSGEGTAADIYGFYELRKVSPGSTVQFRYVGFKTKEVTFTGKIPPEFNVTLKRGHGTEKEEFFYDPNDKSEYFDLKGNKLASRPSKKGTYIRVSDGKAERFSVN